MFEGKFISLGILIFKILVHFFWPLYYVELSIWSNPQGLDLAHVCHKKKSTRPKRPY